MQQKLGFTIAELLVCIAIIAILAAIIASYLISSKDKSRQSVCLSNMKQIHAAVMLYRQDYDGGESGNSVADLGLPKSVEGLSMWGYIKNPEIMWCPNREITPFGRNMKSYGSLWSYEDYSLFKKYYNFAKKHQEDHNWPLFLCPFEDTNFLRNHPVTTPKIVSAINLDGSVYRFDYKRIQSLGGNNEILDEIYK